MRAIQGASIPYQQKGAVANLDGLGGAMGSMSALGQSAITVTNAFLDSLQPVAYYKMANDNSEPDNRKQS